MQSKKQLILWVLNVLNSESDEKHPMTQTKIAEIISALYPCDRKTVSRNIKFLKDMGYPIKKTQKGFFMDRKRFSLEEVLFVKAAIAAASGKEESEKKALAERVADVLTTKYEREL